MECTGNLEHYNVDRNGKSFKIEVFPKVWCMPEHEFCTNVLDLMYKYRRQINGSCVLDVGTGTGLMSIYASLLGAKEILALDIQSESVQCATENTKEYSNISVINYDFRNGIENDYDIIIANLPLVVQDMELHRLLSSMTESSLMFLTNHSDFRPKGFDIVDKIFGKECDGFVLRRSQ